MNWTSVPASFLTSGHAWLGAASLSTLHAQGASAVLRTGLSVCLLGKSSPL